MQPVDLLSDVKSHYGAWGYSALVNPLLGGEPVRQTMLYFHDAEGRFQHCIILDAATVREKVW